MDTLEGTSCTERKHLFLSDPESTWSVGHCAMICSCPRASDFLFCWSERKEKATTRCLQLHCKYQVSYTLVSGIVTCRITPRVSGAVKLSSMWNYTVSCLCTFTIVSFLVTSWVSPDVQYHHWYQAVILLVPWCATPLFPCNSCTIIFMQCNTTIFIQCYSSRSMQSYTVHSMQYNTTIFMWRRSC